MSFVRGRRAKGAAPLREGARALRFVHSISSLAHSISSLVHSYLFACSRATFDRVLVPR